MFVIREKPPPFSDVAGHVAGSTVAIAVGMREGGRPNIIGTGFALETAEFFATCWHVAKAQDELQALASPRLQEIGLIDTKLRFGVRLNDGTYTWIEQAPQTWFRVPDETEDVCIFRVVGLSIPPMSVPTDGLAWLWGEEVGIIGFPLGNDLQGHQVRPFVIKTVIAGAFELDQGDGNHVPKVVVGATLAGGFSGGPIFSASTAELRGMVSSGVMDRDHQTASRWAAGLSLGVIPDTLQRGHRALAKQTTDVIVQSLRKTLP